MWSETAHDKDAPDKVETSASQWVSSLVLRWSVSSPLLEGEEMVVWRVGSLMLDGAVQNGYRRDVDSRKVPPQGAGWQKTEWQIWGEVPVYFQILRNQDCNEQESVLSREAAWPGIFFELTFTKTQEVGRDFSPCQPFPPTPGTEKSQFLPFFCFPKLRKLFLHSFFYLTYPSSENLGSVKNESLQ